MLDYLARAAEVDTVAEYLARYNGPVDVVLDNGTVLCAPRCNC